MSFIAREPPWDRRLRVDAGRVAALLLASAGMIGCQMLASPETITGEIDDTEIRLAQDSAPAAVRLELRHVGSTPCELVPILTALPPEALPVVDGRVVMTLSGDDDRPEPMEAYVELNGEPVAREGGLMTEQGWVTRIDPGDKVMLDISGCRVSRTAPSASSSATVAETTRAADMRSWHSIDRVAGAVARLERCAPQPCERRNLALRNGSALAASLGKGGSRGCGVWENQPPRFLLRRRPSPLTGCVGDGRIRTTAR